MEEEAWGGDFGALIGCLLPPHLPLASKGKSILSTSSYFKDLKRISMKFKFMVQVRSLGFKIGDCCVRE